MSHPLTARRHARLRAASEYALQRQNLKISTDTLRRLIDRGDLTGYHLPGSPVLYVDLAEIDCLLQPVQPAAAAS